ncbi:MAG: LVIVD repeat-containing protein, partial [Planctomycetota bacterium]
VLLKTWGAGIFTHSHDIAIDTDTGTGYACGTDIGMVIFNLSADPANPVQTGVYNAHYVHDLHVQHGLAHLAAINDGFYRIVTVPGLVTLDQVTTPGGFPHNTWANADDTIVATTDEVVGGRMTLYDISNPSSIKFLSSMTIDPSVIIHNVFIKGPRAYVSWYVDGLGVIDISDPANPSVVGTYDTNAATGGSFTGAWGCYPFAPSGVIYISDLENGLFILQEDDPPADTIVLTGDTAVRVGNRGTYAWSQAPANSPYWFYLSKKMNGTAVNGHSFDIGPGLKIMKTGTTDAAGAAGFTSAPVRAKFANKSFHVEIRVDSGGRTFDSNSLTINILP